MALSGPSVRKLRLAREFINEEEAMDTVVRVRIMGAGMFPAESAGYGHDFGPMSALGSCPILSDKCNVHSNADECALDGLCAWCTTSNVCVGATVGKLKYSEEASCPASAVREAPKPECPGNTFVTFSANGRRRPVSDPSSCTRIVRGLLLACKQAGGSICRRDRGVPAY